MQTLFNEMFVILLMALFKAPFMTFFRGDKFAKLGTAFIKRRKKVSRHHSRISVCEQKRVSMTEQIRGETGYYEIPGNSERHSSCKLSTIISKCLIEQVINMGKQLPGFHHVLLLMNISCKNWPNQFRWSYILMLELGISKAIKHPKKNLLASYFITGRKQLFLLKMVPDTHVFYAESNLCPSLKLISW